MFPGVGTVVNVVTVLVGATLGDEIPITDIGEYVP